MMSQTDVTPERLLGYLDSLAEQKATGTLRINDRLSGSETNFSHLLIWKQGQIVYIGTEISPIQDFVKNAIQKFKPDIVNITLSFIANKITQPDSIRHYLELLVAIKIFTWEQIEEWLYKQAVIFLETILYFNVSTSWSKTVDFDISYGDDRHGFSWSKLKSELADRQQKWQKIITTVPAPNATPKIINGALQKITDSATIKHLQQWVDGRRTIVDIAIGLDKDPLTIANTYSQWVSQGWVICKTDSAINTAPIKIDIPEKERVLPKILSVDDSPVIQTAIKKALIDNYTVIFVNDGKSALGVLKQQPIDLILLDVTMPDIDGLSLCKMIRNMSGKFAKMPIIMLTARDKFSDKFKGYAAGSTDYLTKPFNAEDLKKIIEQYLDRS